MRLSEERLAVVRNALLLDGRLVDIHLMDGRITRVQDVGAVNESGLAYDAAGRLVLPAFADVHTHLDKAFSAPVPELDDIPGEPRLGRSARLMNHVKASQTVAAIADRARRAVELMLMRGTTAIRSHVDVDPRIGLRGLEAVLQVQREMAELVDIQISLMPTEKDWRFPSQALDLVLEGLEQPGVTVMGGVTCFENPPEVIVEACHELAVERDLAIDIHVDEIDDPSHRALLRMAERALADGWVGRVTGGHCSSLSLQTPEIARRIIERVAEAELTVVAMPITNLYLLGNDPHVPGFRGMTRVRDLLRGGARVATASDNIRDPYMPYGNGDLMLSALLACLVGQLDSPEEQRSMLDAATTVPRQAMFPAEPVGVESGARADLVVLEHRSTDHVLAAQPQRAQIIRAGRLLQ